MIPGLRTVNHSRRCVFAGWKFRMREIAVEELGLKAATPL